MQSAAEVSLRSELAPGERLLWSGGPFIRSHWRDPGLWVVRVFLIGWIGAIFFFSVRRHVPLEVSVIDLLVPLVLGVVAASVLPVAVYLAYRSGQRSRSSAGFRGGDLLIGLGWVVAWIALEVGWSDARDLPVSEVIIPMVMVLAGTGMLAFTFFGTWASGVTAYGLTDRHALVLRRGPFGGSVERWPLDRMTEVAFKGKRGGRGTIRFPDFARTCGEDAECVPGFVDIEDARRVYDLVEAARAATRRAGGW